MSFTVREIDVITRESNILGSFDTLAEAQSSKNKAIEKLGPRDFKTYVIRKDPNGK